MARTMKTRGILLFVFAFTGLSMAQTPASRKPQFDVVSIRRNTAEGNANIGDQPGGRFVASHIALRRVIQFAYRDNQQFIGGPDWLDTDRWDIEAKAPEGTVSQRSSPFNVAAPDTLALMVQSLLEDRFGLKAHQETRQLPLYELVVAKGGLKLKLSDDQTPPAALSGAGGAQRGATLTRGGIRLGRGDLEARAQSLSILATALGALYLDRPVIDKTGLKGLYDIRLQWTSDPRPTVSAGTAAAPADSGLSLFNAVEEQLGLKLESGKGPLPVLLIDSILRPSEN
jgi:uncharacterized protein (TIGR03435 family)